MKNCFFCFLWGVACITNVFAQEQEVEKYAYAKVSNNGTTLTFYYDLGYDNEEPYNAEQEIGPFGGWRSRPWTPWMEKITTVVFDDSFADYTELKSTACWFYGFEKLTTLPLIPLAKTTSPSSNTRRCSDIF